MRKKILIIGMAVMMSIGLAACTQSSTSTQDKGQETSVTSDMQSMNSTEQGPSGDILSVKKIPEFKAKTTEGKDISNEVFKDSKLTLVNLWGSWCQPCVQEIPELQKLYDNMKDKGVNVIGLAQDGNTELDAVKEILAGNNVTYTNIVPEGKLFDFVMSSQYFPISFLVDSEGNIVGNIQGSNTLEGFTKEVEKALEQLK